MPDKRKHRGTAPGDPHIFGDSHYADLCGGVADLSLLLSKGYPPGGSLKLVGDRFGFTDRQRLAIRRCACSDEQLKSRNSRRVDIAALGGQCLLIDGFNLLITVEAALSGGAVFVGRDCCCRDLSGIHGSYRRVSETLDAFAIVADFLDAAEVSKVKWLFDRPVSNSGKLKVIACELAEENGWPWEVELFDNPDNELIASESIISTSDSDVLDRCGRWFNLSAEIVKICTQPDGRGAFVVDVSG
ncbi:MAG: DUF434 domain-containing protein [Phycisphaerae bacterium]|nr:DUF434 domain-containing protein [Phycisphaerae bacterium]